ncbi:MAG: amidohydrolase family protein [Deltaproteobacteria bacterium]|nr:amidohydrolase family protein [Deltaproteobacteria bacterium]
MEDGRTLRKLADVALGKAPADMVIKNGVLMDVYTGRMVPDRSVAMADKWISYVGPDAGYAVGPETHVIDAGGRVICPGYIDAHTHLVNYSDFSDFLAYAIPSGVTTVLTEIDSYAFALGKEGINVFLAQTESCPITVYVVVPPMVSLSPATAPIRITKEQLSELLTHRRVMGLGESYWQGAILTRDGSVLDLMAETRKMRKSIQGHAAGAFDRKLAAYVATGVESCHEAISTEDVLNRLEMGLYAMIREGDIRRDLEIILPLKDKVDFRRMILVTDGTNPDFLLKKGYLHDVVQKAVDLGVAPMDAVRMVTLNPAEHLGLDNLIGGVAPGRYGDLLLLADLNNMMPEMVISKGRIVAEKGHLCISIADADPPEILLNTVNVEPISPADLGISKSLSDEAGRIRSIDIQPGGLVAREGRGVPVVSDKYLMSDPEKDLLKIVFIERISGKGEMFVGFVRGWGQKRGAVATSTCWDAGGIVGIGENDADLAAAVNRVIEIQGGMSLFVEGRLEAEIPLRAGGYVSELKMPELALRLENFQNIMVSLGFIHDNALLSLSVMTAAAIPFIRMTEKGYYRFRENDFVGLAP